MHPTRKREEEYAEKWTNLPVTQGSQGIQDAAIVVLVGKEEESKTTGLIVRVGDLCQGMVQCKTTGAVTLERWKRDSLGHPLLVQRAIRPHPEVLVLPCAFAYENNGVGYEKKVGSLVWRVVEAII